MQTSKIKYDRSVIFTKAHEIKREKNIPFSEALQQSWKITKANALKYALNLGIVYFSFIKADGSLREAKGTMNMDFFTPLFVTDRHLQVSETEYTGTVKYWDLEVNNWRCCRVDRLEKLGNILIYAQNEVEQQFAVAA